MPSELLCPKTLDESICNLRVSVLVFFYHFYFNLKKKERKILTSV